MMNPIVTYEIKLVSNVGSQDILPRSAHVEVRVLIKHRDQAWGVHFAERDSMLWLSAKRSCAGVWHAAGVAK